MTTNTKNTADSLYFNCWDIVKSTNYFIYIFIGGRGVGKTYSTLRGAILDNVNFMYTRRSETELNNSCNKDNNPFNAINRDLNRNIELKGIKDTFSIYENDTKIGIAGALTTFGKFRGADFGQIDYIIFDEFIRTNNFKIKNEDSLFFNMLETVGRNRELQGKNHLKSVLLSNANTIDNDIITTLKLGEVIHQLKQAGQSVYTDEERQIYLQLIDNVEFANMKKETALYKLTKGTAFYDMAVSNDFVYDSFEDIKKIDFKKLTPIVRYDKITLFNIKNSNDIYVSYRNADCKTYTLNDKDRFKKDFGQFLYIHLLNGSIKYYDYDLKLYIKNIFN